MKEEKLNKAIEIKKNLARKKGIVKRIKGENNVNNIRITICNNTTTSPNFGNPIEYYENRIVMQIVKDIIISSLESEIRNLESEMDSL